MFTPSEMEVLATASRQAAEQFCGASSRERLLDANFGLDERKRALEWERDETLRAMNRLERSSIVIRTDYFRGVAWREIRPGLNLENIERRYAEMQSKVDALETELKRLGEQNV